MFELQESVKSGDWNPLLYLALTQSHELTTQEIDELKAYMNEWLDRRARFKIKKPVANIHFVIN